MWSRMSWDLGMLRAELWCWVNRGALFVKDEGAVPHLGEHVCLRFCEAGGDQLGLVEVSE